MSQIGKAIMAIKGMFEHRKEELCALKLDKEIFIAAYKFNKLIEGLERKDTGWLDEIRKEEAEELSHGCRARCC